MMTETPITFSIIIPTYNRPERLKTCLDSLLNLDYPPDNFEIIIPYQNQLNLIEPIFQRVFSSRFLQDDFTICWHAGEPLAVPISFYESAFAKIAEVSEKYNQQGYCLGASHLCK